MELTGVIKHIGDVQELTSKRGSQYQMVTAVIETQESYPNSMAFELINNGITELVDIGVGNLVRVTFYSHAREFNGKWYNSFRVQKVERMVAYNVS